jgi:plastocyanin
MRWRWLVAGGVAVVAGLAMPARAANQTVEAGGVLDTFAPKTITVNVGDTVTWHNAGGGHDVKFPGEAAMPALPADPATFNAAGVSKTFDQPGTFRYYCTAHATDENDPVGMTGTVVVVGSGPSPTPSPTPEPVPLPFVAKVVNSGSCTARGCPGIKVRVRSSRRVAVDGLVLQRDRHGTFQPLGNIHFKTRDGRRTIVLRRVGALRLTPGAYRLELTADGFVGTAKVRFRVAPPD